MYEYENPPFNSLVWGSLRLTPIRLEAWGIHSTNLLGCSCHQLMSSWNQLYDNTIIRNCGNTWLLFSACLVRIVQKFQQLALATIICIWKMWWGSRQAAILHWGAWARPSLLGQLRPYMHIIVLSKKLPSRCCYFHNTDKVTRSLYAM